MSISATAVLSGILNVTGVVNLLPGSRVEDAADNPTRITGEIKGLTKGQSYTLKVDQWSDLGTVTGGAGGVTQVDISSLISLDGPLSVIGHTLAVFDGDPSKVVASGVITRTT